MLSSKDEIEKVTTELGKDEPDLDTVESALTQMPVWIENLRASTVQTIMKLTVSACAKVLRGLEAKGEAEDDPSAALVSSVEKFLALLRNGKALFLKMPDLAPLMSKAAEGLENLKGKQRTAALQKVLEPFVSEDARKADEGREEKETNFVAFCTDDVFLHPPPSKLHAEMHTTIMTLADRLSQWAGAEQDEAENDEPHKDHVNAVASALGRLQRWLGQDYEPGQKDRDVAMRLVTASVALRIGLDEAAVLLEKKDSHTAEQMRADLFFPQAVHVQSLIARLAEVLLESSGVCAAAEDVAAIRENIKGLTEKGNTVVASFKDLLHGIAMERLGAQAEHGKRIYGNPEVQKRRGMGFWAHGLAADAQWPALVAHAQKSLLKEDYAEKIGNFVKACQQEHLSTSCP